jgi:type I restriction enzyme M protein
MTHEKKQPIRQAQGKQLESTLWNIADTLRGKMDADDFRDYILGFIFYKYLSEKMHAYANTILKPDKIKYEDLEKHKNKKAYLAAIKEEALEKLGYFLLPSELFSEMARRGNAEGKSKFILDDLSKVLTHIEQSTMGSESEEDFGNLFEDLDLKSSKLGKTESAKNELIVKVLSKLDEIDFDLQNTESDVLGDAYEYLIGKFASGAGKKAGEFYTPQQVSSVLARLVTIGKTKLKSVYDPTCGSGSLLLRVAKEVKEVGGFYGQESNPTTYNLCRMNMIMHDVHYKKFDIKNEDTLERPQHIDQRFEAIVANPPFSAEWSASPLFMSDERYSNYGRLAPKGTADFAFVQHMIHQLADNGTMACVLPHGVLFRGGAEGHIREHLIKEKNYLDAVIGLPANIFYGTSIPTCILVLKKKRQHPENVLFIDASQLFEKIKTQNYLRSGDIDKIISAYKSRSNEAKYSHVAEISEIEENDYNLNIPRYVDTFEEEDAVDLKALVKELKKIDLDSKNTDSVISKYCKELGIESPF